MRLQLPCLEVAHGNAHDVITMLAKWLLYLPHRTCPALFVNKGRNEPRGESGR